MVGPTELIILAVLAGLVFLVGRRGRAAAPGRATAPAAARGAWRGWTGILVVLASAALLGVAAAVGVRWLQVSQMAGSLIAGAAAGLAGAIVAMSAAAARRR